MCPLGFDSHLYLHGTSGYVLFPFLQVLGSKASTICSKLKKPSKADAQVLKNLFPSSSSTVKRAGATFDPSDECVASVQQEKKKKAIRFKSSKITVLAVDAAKGIPKGKYRKELKKNGSEKTIEIKRYFSPQNIRSTIIKAFGFSDYKILNCTSDGKLIYAADHLPSGDDVIEGMTKRKFPLYIEENYK